MKPNMKEITITLIKDADIESIVVICEDEYLMNDGKWLVCRIDASNYYCYNTSHILSIKTNSEIKSIL